MSAAQKKESLHGVLIVTTILLFIIIIADWLVYNNIYLPARGNPLVDVFISLLFKINAMGTWKIKILYVISLTCLVWLVPNLSLRKKNNLDKKTAYTAGYIILSAAVIFGYISGMFFYNTVIYLLILSVHIPVTAIMVSLYGKMLTEESVLGGLSNKTSDFSFILPTNRGPLTIHSPQQNCWIDGGPGSGKSQSLIKPIIKQCGLAGIAGIVYDFEGDPREPDAPVLGRIAYTSVKEGKKNGTNGNLNFSFLNFNDPLRTVRVNPLSSKYISGRLDIQDMIQNLMSNLSVNKGKSDFWEKYGTCYIFGITYHLYSMYPDKCSIPYVVSTALNSIDTVLRWASDNDETRMIMAPLFSAWENNATSQLAGAETSGQLPISVLLDPNIFWVMSEDEFSLDITNKEHPYLFCIGNSKKQQQAIAPAISVIITVLMKQMNSAGKNKSAFIFDEFPTVKVNGIDTFIATARKHKVATILALQDFEQAVRDYGDKEANILRTACGNHFFGMTGNLKTAEFISNSLGDIKKENISFSTGADSQSMSQSLQKEKVIQSRDILGQSIGHFTGKIAGGDPAWFSAQFDEFKYPDEAIPEFGSIFELIQKNKIPESRKQEVTKNIVQANYNAIHASVKEMLAPFTKAQIQQEKENQNTEL